MSTAAVSPLDMDRLNGFIGRFVTDLGAAVHTGMVCDRRETWIV